jgi:hypothetical protein
MDPIRVKVVSVAMHRNQDTEGSPGTSDRVSMRAMVFIQTSVLPQLRRKALEVVKVHVHVEYLEGGFLVPLL